MTGQLEGGELQKLSSRRRAAAALLVLVGSSFATIPTAAAEDDVTPPEQAVLELDAPVEPTKTGGDAAPGQDVPSEDVTYDELGPAGDPGPAAPLPPKPVDDLGVGGDIVGGSPASVNEYPYYVSLQTSTGGAFCGGTLVSPTRVVTAAHCVDDNPPLSTRRVRIGGTTLSGTDEGEIRNISAIVIDPNYTPNYNGCNIANDDLAVLHLSTPSTKPWTRLADFITPLGENDPILVMGHGRTTGGGSGSNTLLEATMPYRLDSQVSAAWGSCFDSLTMFGAGTPSGTPATCQGDSGGPVVDPTYGEVNEPLLGAVSWGPTGCSVAGAPSVFAELYDDPGRTFIDGQVARPANDQFASAQAISGAAGSVYGTTTAATAQTGEPNYAGPEATVWYSWTAPSSAPVTFDVNTLGSSFPVSWDSTLAVYTGLSASSLTEVVTNDDYNGRESRVTFTPTSGAVYRIRVDAYSLLTETSAPSTLKWGDFQLGWSQSRPANDDYANASAITSAWGRTAQSMFSPTHEPSEPDNHWNDSDSSVWYAWTAPASGPATVSLAESGFDTTMAVYTGSLSSLTLVASNDDVFAPARQSKVNFTATAGTVYRIAVDEYASGDPVPDNLALQWSVGRPVNDDVGAATVLSGMSGSIAGTTALSTQEPAEVAPVVAPSELSVWYRWTAPATGDFNLSVTAAGGTWDPQLGVWDGSYLGSQTLVIADDDSGPGLDPALVLSATSGTTYWLQVEGRNITSGAFTLAWAPVPPPGPLCDGLAVTISGSGVINGTAGDDVILGSNGVDTINGLGGNDTICALDGDDTVLAGAGNDKVLGGAGNDTMHGGLGDDTLNGGGGQDGASYAASATGVSASLATGVATGEGTDALVSVENLYGSAQADTLSGNGLTNVITGGSGPDLIEGSSGDDLLFGEGGPDELRGGPGNDVLNGGAAADVLRGDDGNDHHVGGTEVDTVSYRNATVGVTVDLAAGTASGQGNDTIANDVEDILGSQQDDVLSGDAQNNKIQGRGGQDQINGRDGNDDLRGNGKDDTILGGNGNDRVHGGSGADNLTGGSGDDEMIGSTGTPDTCDGGPGTDTHGGGCETLIGIP